MIIKGGSRSGPKWLGRHLTRLDTNERIHVMELQSPHADLTEAFRDWQVIAEGTRGYKGLYHANIDPAMDYTMTPEQWWRCVDVLERELGMEGQPRAVVLHEKHGRTHLHIVWSRADLDTMTLRSDSHNYQAHERASLALEQEFGHEHVPGKHAKRDRDRQQDMPGAEISHAEWQQAERAGTDPRARKQQITQLYEASDTGPAFKAALEDAGYLLAQGDRRDFVLVDGTCGVHSLARQIKGLGAADLRAFMEGVNREELPDAEAARQIQAARIEEARQPAVEPPPADIASELAEERRHRLLERHAEQLDNLERSHNDQLSILQARQQQEAERERDALAERLTRNALAQKPSDPEGFEKLWRDIRESISPDEKQARLDDERSRREAHDAARLAEVKAMVEAFDSRHRAEIAALVDQQAAERADILRLHEEELALLSDDAERLRAIERELEAKKREIEARNRDGPDPFDRAR